MNRRAQPWLGTLVDITIVDAIDDQCTQAAFAHTFAQIALVHRLMSFHDPLSDVSRFNRATVGQVLTVDQHTFDVLKLAADIAKASDHAFDVACASRLVTMAYLPDSDSSIPAYVPHQPVYALEGNQQIKKLSDAWIDLGGIAKGYAVDQAIEALQQLGIGQACVNAGGDLRVIGDHAHPVAIRSVQDPLRFSTQVMLQNEAIATSATYFSAKQHAGELVSALIDGASGDAIAAHISASVRAPTCAIADALTKVVIATNNALHPILKYYQASAFII